MIECVRLLTGEDLIGEVKITQGGESLKISKPAQIIMAPKKEGGLSLSLMPWLMFSADETFSIQTSQVIAIHNATPELRNAYSDQFGSGIVIPTSPVNTSKILLG